MLMGVIRCKIAGYNLSKAYDGFNETYEYIWQMHQTLQYKYDYICNVFFDAFLAEEV